MRVHRMWQVKRNLSCFRLIPSTFTMHANRISEAATLLCTDAVVVHIGIPLILKRGVDASRHDELIQKVAIIPA